MNEKPRRLLQFRLADLLWAALVAALITGWLVERSYGFKRLHRAYLDQQNKISELQQQVDQANRERAAFEERYEQLIRERATTEAGIEP